MLRNVKRELKSKGSKYTFLHFVIACFVLSSLLSGFYPYPEIRKVSADTQFSQRPRGVRVAHLGADPVPGRMDYIFRQRSSSAPGTITAYAPGGTLLFSIPPDPFQPIQELLDVMDMDGDGSAEIIGVHGGDGISVAPVLYIYDGFGNLRTRFEFFPGMTLGFSGVKIYNLWPNSNQFRLVAVPNTFPNFTGFINSTFVYFSIPMAS